MNYEIQIRGKKNLNSVSKKIIINKGKDLLEAVNPNDMKKFRKAAAAIKELKLDWSKEVQKQQEQAFSEIEKKIS